MRPPAHLTSPAFDVRIFLGKSGQGKTTLAKHQAAPRRRVLIFDPTHDATLSAGALITSDPGELLDLIAMRGALTICWRHPGADDFNAFEWGNRAALAAENFTMLWDEVDTLAPGGRLPPYAYRCANLGRHSGISIYAASRRPARVPRDLMAAATRICAFRTTDQDDLKYLRHYIGRAAAEELPRLADHCAIDWTERQETFAGKIAPFD